ncbi:Gfo/Idh/MocA family oxidoreductase [bacterium]|nr:Gfo/Idh/MocA family oxidoreductase [bacterium]MCI0604112.1 Gfo/Idh/MocA family oxidoreductase [bacterium]
MRLALIGIGHQGKHHLRFLKNLPGVDPVLLVDIVSEKAIAAGQEYHLPYDTSYRSRMDQFDAAIIAVPTSDHFAISTELIRAGKHVLIEKPVAATAEEAEQLADLAAAQGIVAHVGLPERFNPVVRRALSDITRPLFIETHRLGVFSPRSLDIDVVLDLMIHDLDLLYLFLKEEPAHIEAVGIPILSRQIDITNARLKFPGKCVVNLTASRVSGKRMRKMRLFQPYSYLSLDLAEQTLSQFSLQPNLCNAGFPEISQQEYKPEERQHPLLEELSAFRDAVAGRSSSGVEIRESLPSLKMALAVKQCTAGVPPA